MRIIYDNAIDRATTITASSTATGFSASNLRNNLKSSVHRSTSSSVTYTATWSTGETISGIALPATNLLAGDTIGISLNGGVTTTVQACGNRTVLLLDGTTTPTYQHFGFGGATKTSFWYETPQTGITSLAITLTRVGRSTAIDCSKIVCGNYWQSSRMPSNGILLGSDDNSEITATRTGNLYIDRRYLTETMSFSLQYIDDTDRQNLLNIFRTWGTSGFVYVCVFPDNANPEITQSYSIYGRSTSNQLEYALHSLYNSSLNIAGW